MATITDTTAMHETSTRQAKLPALLPFIGIFVVAMILPFVSNDYWALIGTRAAIYWFLVAGLNLVVGFAGHLAIGYVALLTLGAYTTSVLASGNVMPPLPVFVSLIVASCVGAVFGVIVGLPAMRLRTFYFAMTTLGFATIVTQIALAWQSVTGGGVGIVGPEMPAPFNTPWGFYYLCIGLGAVATWLSANVAHSRFGRALIAIRDVDVAAEATGISKPKLLVSIFLLAGAMAAFAGGLFASLQTYITPDAFTFDLSVLFFIAILIGGRGSILGPMLGTIILTILPEIAAPLAAWSTFLYAVLLLVIVLVMPGGIAALLDFKSRRPLASNRAIVPRPAVLAEALRKTAGQAVLSLREVVLTFGNVRAIDGLDLDVKPGQVHGLIGPNGSGKTTTLNVLSGLYEATSGKVVLDGTDVTTMQPHLRAAAGLGRTFQNIRLFRSMTALENVVIGAERPGNTLVGKGDHTALTERALAALTFVGLGARANELISSFSYGHQRLIEIARALAGNPTLLLLDEPAAGLNSSEKLELHELLKRIAAQGLTILIIDHDMTLVSEAAQHITVLNFGRRIADGESMAVLRHPDVVSAYLGTA